MHDKLTMFVLGGLSTGAVFSIGTFLYYQLRHQKLDSKVVMVDRKRYLDLIESLSVTKGELELIMKDMVANGSTDYVYNEALDKALKTSLNNLRRFTATSEQLTSDVEDFGTPPSGSLEGFVYPEEPINLKSTDYHSWAAVSMDGYHSKEFYELWQIHMERNKNMDYYISCAIEYSQNPIRIQTIRTSMLQLNDDVDYIIKVIAVRGAFNLLNDNLSNVNWFIETLQNCFVQILEIADKPTAQFNSAFEDLLSFAMDSKNSKRIEDELLEERIGEYNTYDVVVDFMILDSLSDLDCLPSAILSVTKSRFITRSLRENAFCTLVWSYIQSKIKKLKSPNGFLAKYYNLCHTLSPVLAWGFLGDNGTLNTACNSFKNSVMKFVVKIFDENKVLYENKFDLADDILKCAKKTHRELSKQFQILKE